VTGRAEGVRQALVTGSRRFLTTDQHRHGARLDFTALAVVVAELIADDLDTIAQEIDRTHLVQPAPLSVAVRLLRTRADWLRSGQNQ
jgi:hypothetical protein